MTGSVYDWLKTIRNRGGDSPIIVVTNKCDDERHNLRLDEIGLKRDHAGIVGFLRTSCDATESAAASIARLRALIVDTLSGDPRLKHVRDPIPRPWLRVKESVAAMAREKRVLEMRDFERLYEHSEGVLDSTNQVHVTGYAPLSSGSDGQGCCTWTDALSFDGASVEMIRAVHACSKRPDLIRARNVRSACPPMIRQRMPERFMRCVTRVLLAASTTPEPMANSPLPSRAC